MGDAGDPSGNQQDTSRQAVQHARTEALRNPQPDAAGQEFPYAPAIEQPQPEEAATIEAAIMPEGIEVTILIPWSGIISTLPQPVALTEQDGTPEA